MNIFNIQFRARNVSGKNNNFKQCVFFRFCCLLLIILDLLPSETRGDYNKRHLDIVMCIFSITIQVKNKVPTIRSFLSIVCFKSVLNVAICTQYLRRCSFRTFARYGNLVVDLSFSNRTVRVNCRDCSRFVLDNNLITITLFSVHVSFIKVKSVLILTATR